MRGNTGITNDLHSDRVYQRQRILAIRIRAPGRVQRMGSEGNNPPRQDIIHSEASLMVICIVCHDVFVGRGEFCSEVCLAIYDSL